MLDYCELSRAIPSVVGSASGTAIPRMRSNARRTHFERQDAQFPRGGIASAIERGMARLQLGYIPGAEAGAQLSTAASGVRIPECSPARGRDHWAGVAC